MKKSDIAILLSPSIIFVVIAFASFLMAQLIKDLPSIKDRERQQNWDTVFKKLEDGKWKLKYDKATEDSMLEALRFSNGQVARQQEFNESVRGIIYCEIILAILGGVFQVAIVFLMRGRITKRNNG